MDFWTILKLVGVFAFLALFAGLIIWQAVSLFGELLNMNAGFHDLQLAGIISAEDRESLTKEDWKKTRRMDYTEMKAFLNERFPNSIPELRKHECA